MAISEQLFQESQEALYVLADVWESMLKVLEQAAQASASSFTDEPNLDDLQRCRQTYEGHLKRLKTKLAWIQDNRQTLNDKQHVERDDPALVEKQQQLRQRAQDLSDRLKQLLGDSSSLQFELDVILASTDYHPVQQQH
ncbi:hypothetical protein BC940DRAFT_346816 [Gongronella butleri]|nr:hypothetical protein BC940DRAFT_346816 [Gongronella butleri]